MFGLLEQSIAGPYSSVGRKLEDLYVNSSVEETHVPHIVIEHRHYFCSKTSL
jgi:hypothetical protein